MRTTISKQKRSRISHFQAILPLLFGILFMIGCGDSPKEPEGPIIAEQPEDTVPEKPTGPTCNPSMTSFETVVDGIDIDIKAPSGPSKGIVLVLPGWNYSRSLWCEKSTLCDKLLAAGYYLVMPEMGKSVYASEVYPETRKDWRQYKTGTWVRDTMIPYLAEKHCLLVEGANNHVLGLSTGGRGAVLTALYKPGLFKSCISISGDYDQRLMDDDNLMTGWYGPFADFQNRWGGKDNAIVHAHELKTPVLIIHGRKDEVVPESQAHAFNQVLEDNNPGLYKSLFLGEGMGHDWEFWEDRTEMIVMFLDQILQITGQAPRQDQPAP